MQSTKSTQSIYKKDLWCYSFPALAIAFAGMPIYIYAPDYFSSQYQVPLGLLGFILLFLRVIDAIQDPMIGRYCDLYKHNRIRIFIFSSVALCVSFLLLFQPQWAGENLIIIWFAIFIFLTSLFYSILTINLNTLGGLWSRDSYQKTRIAGFRESFTLIGLLLAVLLPSIFQLHFNAQDSFFIVSMLLFGLMFLGLLFFNFWKKNHLNEIETQFSPVRQTVNLLSLFQSLGNSMRLFYLTYAVSLFASSIPAVLVLFFIRDRLDAFDLTGLFLSAYFLSSAFAMPIWTKLSKIKGKFQSWFVAMLLAIISFIWAFFLESGDVWQYLLICVLSGVAFGADLSLPTSILADKIENETHCHYPTFYFGFLSFIAKCTLALGSAVSFFVLDWFDFKPNQTNSNQALWALSFCYAFIPCLIKLFALKLTYNHISKDK